MRSLIEQERIVYTHIVQCREEVLLAVRPSTRKNAEQWLEYWLNFREKIVTRMAATDAQEYAAESKRREAEESWRQFHEKQVPIVPHEEEV